MSDDGDGPIDVFLQPGDLFVADAGYRIRTVLGSCVSITLWHPASRSGGMSHFLLPSRGNELTGTRHDELDGRYGDEALSVMLAELARLGVAPSQCQGKIFGGGNMFPAQTRAGSIPVGQRNGEAACLLLKRRGIPIVSTSLYGAGHRQIIFDLATGDVWSNQVKPTRQEIESERESERSLR
jgi:chemotaxis protein CheD